MPVIVKEGSGVVLETATVDGSVTGELDPPSRSNTVVFLLTTAQDQTH